MLRFAILLSNILSELTVRGEPVVVSLSVPRGYDRSVIVGLHRSVNVIECDLIAVPSDDFRYEEVVAKGGAWPEVEYYTFPEAVDAKQDIVLADAWLLLTGLLPHGPLLPLKPYVVYAPDFIQRIVPEIFGRESQGVQWYMNTWQCLTMQRSQAVLVTTPRTAADATSYAGVPRDKVHLFPMIYEMPAGGRPVVWPEEAERKTDAIRAFLEAGPARLPAAMRAALAGGPDHRTGGADPAPPRPYFVWVTNTTQHKNHLRALAALERYYGPLQGSLRCVVCGANTLFFRPGAPEEHPYYEAVREIIERTGHMGGMLEIAGELDDGAFREVLRSASFLWHNVLYDNGTFAVIEAAALGTRSLVSRYPQMTYITDLFGINARTFDPWDVEDTADALKAMELVLVEEGAGASLQDPGDLQPHFAGQLHALLHRL